MLTKLTVIIVSLYIYVYKIIFYTLNMHNIIYVNYILIKLEK